MSLGYKITIVVLLVISSLLVLDYIAFKRTISPAFSELELTEAELNNTRLIKTIDDALETLVTYTIDWGEWDITYKFIVDHNEEYIENNLTPELILFQDEQLALLFIIDLDGKLLWGNVYDPNKDELVPVSDFFPNMTELSQYFLEHTTEEHNEHGIIESSNGPMLVSSNAILNNSGEGPMLGIFMMGRLLPGTVLNTVADQTQLDIAYWPLKNASENFLQEEALEYLPGQGEIISKIQNETTLSTYAFVPFLFGEGGTLFRINTERSINAISNATVQLIFTINLIVVLALMLVLFLSLRHIVIKPLAKLQSKVGAIEIDPSLEKLHFDKLFDGGSDEISELAKEFDVLLDNISEKNLKLKFEVDERIKVEEQLSYFANHDPLTGLVNRREMGKRIERLIDDVHNNKNEHVFCFFDLDQFKVINDTSGHLAGDEILRQFATMLKQIIREQDTLARLGGDEFGVLMEGCSLKDALVLVQNMLQSIQDYQFVYEHRSFKIGASIGLTSITDATVSLAELLKEADAACYLAKDMGRNCIHIYQADDVEIIQRHGEMQWVGRINEALEKNQFRLFIQKIESLTQLEEHPHYELLLRLEGEDGKIIKPSAFLPAAESYELISKIDCWVIENAFDFLRNKLELLDNIDCIFINISGQSIIKQDFLHFVDEQINRLAGQAHKICFEITETSVISNLNMARIFISSLKKRGCRFALDDFGSGLSSFNYLKNLDLDCLKIDGEFVKNIVNDPVDRAIVKSINDVGHIMGMKTIAEFVETEESLQVLKELGVDYAQGYVIGKPLALEELFKSDAYSVSGKP